MIIGIPKEIKNNENRVSALPNLVKELVNSGNTVLVENNAGLQCGFTNEDYLNVGAQILNSAEEVWSKSEMIYKVKEPLESEYKYFREGLILYTYLHLASVPELAKKLIASKVTSIAYETVQIGNSLPLLRPMSETAGRLAIQEGARFLTSPYGGKGILLQGVPGVCRGNVVILGAGIAGTAAAITAMGLGAHVKILDINIDRLTELSNQFGNKIETIYSTSKNIEDAVKNADLVVSSVLIPGSKAPKLVTKEMIKSMEKGSVIVDIAIDQGGSTEYTENHPTSHDDPVFTVDGIIHYSVANMPGTVAKTSSFALSNATGKYALAISSLGLSNAINKYPELKSGINIFNGNVCHKAVADSLGYEFIEI